MGCFFGCFRFRDSDRPKAHLISKSIASKSRDPLVTRNQLSSMFIFEEKGSPCEQVGCSLQVNLDKESADEEELKHEAQFLKSCGALLETPAEIRKASKENTVQSPNDEGVPSKIYSRVLDTSCKKLHWDDQPGQISDTPANVHGDSHSQENKTGSCHPEEHRTQRKAVSFEEDEHVSSNGLTVDSVGCDVSPVENQIKAHGFDDSPYPTPVNLTEEMPTPGTVYPLNLRTGNNAGVRIQYVYPVLNPVENSFQGMPVKEGNSQAQLVQSADIFEQHTGKSAQDNISLSLLPVESPLNGKNQTVEVILKENLNEDTPKLLPGLSQWLKPPPPKDDRWNAKDVFRERSHSDKSPVADRPIIGLVAAHWNEDEPSRPSAKWINGNGIPNSTNKYKEDQKVNWHATPFEERLEKALSDEKLFPQRKLDGRPINFNDEGEDSDTAAS
ncbi:protein JASON-like [Iris pallida]|uniref:Protein JASON-like n=1 Tax=Iris pallida TaxID=29817 RepID=A0AAX6DLU6_IRIPA|nr:protein JASON-like [Iris pallida]